MGLASKRAGQIFETILERESARSNVVALRIPDGCKQVANHKFIRIKSPFDFVLVDRKTENVVFCDAKSTTANLFPAANIKPHQMKALAKFTGMESIKSGYIVNFEKHCKVVFFSIEQLNASMVTRKGLRHEDGMALGHKHNIDLRNIFQN